MNFEKIKSYIIGIVIVALFFVGQTINANVIMYAKMDSAAIWQGEQTSIKLEVVQDKDAKLELLIPQPELTPGIEVIKVTDGDTLDIKNNRIQINREIIITSFDSGFYSIPPIKSFVDKDTFYTESLSLKVVPVQISEEELDLKDIKGVWSPRFVLFDFIPIYVWIILLVLICIAGGAYFYLKYIKKQPHQEAESIVKIPPHEKALNELNMLKEEKLWQAGQSKLYFTRLTDILREYLYSRFSINAMEMTSTEILTSLKSNKETKLVEKNMKQILEVADFVKFAKMSPLPEDNESAMRNAINFVELTIPQPDEVEESEVIE